VFLRLLLLFSLVPLVECWLLFQIYQQTSLAATLALVLATGALGAWLARRQGLRAISRLQSQMSQGQLPTESLGEGFLILIAGVVLITPGILTDLFGFALLVPPIRSVVRRWLTSRLRRSVRFKSTPPFQGGASGSPGFESWQEAPSGERPADDPQVIDVEVIRPQESPQETSTPGR
jgi:UPF0716 protein FxsA